MKFNTDKTYVDREDDEYRYVGVDPYSGHLLFVRKNHGVVNRRITGRVVGSDKPHGKDIVGEKKKKVVKYAPVDRYKSGPFSVGSFFDNPEDAERAPVHRSDMYTRHIATITWEE